MLILELSSCFFVSFRKFLTTQQLVPREQMLPHDDDKITVNFMNVVNLELQIS